MTLCNGALITWSEAAGPASASDWGRWAANEWAPDPRQGNGFADRWADDFAILASLGFTEIGITLEWATLEPTQGHHDQSAVERLRQLLEVAGSLGIQPWAYLVDGSLPGWFAHDEHGFADDRSRQLLWPRHVEWIGENFADLITGWVPQREPVQQVIRGHLLGVGPPGTNDPEATTKAIRASVLAEGEAWRVLQGSAPVASHQTARSFVTPTDNVPAARHAAHLNHLYHDVWARALSTGSVQVDGLAAVAAPHLKDSFDRIIVQARPPVRVDEDGRWQPVHSHDLVEDLGLAIERTLREVDSECVTVAADLAPVDDDGQRQLEHVLGLRATAEELGADTWWQSSPIDGWHWERGFDHRSGILDEARSPKQLLQAAPELFAS